jgi:hypothetical protein
MLQSLKLVPFGSVPHFLSYKNHFLKHLKATPIA